MSDADHIRRSAHWRLSRLNWLKSKGCEFSFDLDAENKKLSALAPEWKPEYAASAAESHDGRSGWVRTETDFSEVEKLPVAEIIPHIQKIDRRSVAEFVSYEPFLGLSQRRPSLALEALQVSFKRLAFDGAFWRTFLRVDARKGDDVQFSQQIVSALSELSDKELGSIASAAADWFEKSGKALLQADAPGFDRLWNKLIDALRADESVNQSSLVRQGRSIDWATEAINSPAGDLAELLILISPDKPKRLGKKSGFDKTWLQRVEQLLTLPGDSRRYALVIFGFQLVWLFAHDPKWVEANMLNVLDDAEGAEADKDAIWSGVFWRAHVPQLPLYKRLKPNLMQLVRAHSAQRSRHAEMLAGFLLAGWRGDKEGNRLISSDELRALVLDGDEEFRQQILYALDRWSDDEVWASAVPLFLREVWPKQRTIRTSEISSRLCELAFSQKERFPEVAELVAGLVTKVGDSRLFIPELRRTDETLAGQYPMEMLTLLYAVLPENRMHWPWGADAALKALAERMPSIRSDVRFIELEGKAN